MFEGHDETVRALLVESGLAEPARLAALAASGAPLARAVIDEGLATRDDLVALVAAHLGAAPAADLPAVLPTETVALLAAESARRHAVIPLGAESGILTVAAVDPFVPHLIEDLTFGLGRPVRLAVADPTRVAALLRRHYGEEASALADSLDELRAAAPTGAPDELNDAELAQLAGQAPIIRFVNLVLAQAIRDQASDIHFEPFERDFRIRYRIDGTLYELTPPPRALAMPVTSRVKVLANLDIAERRVPQDGRLRLQVSGRVVDLRVSTLPTQFGESVVLRVLDQGAVQLDIHQIGLPPPMQAELTALVRRPHGIVVVTGPTGSGKTTTLYSCLRLLNTEDVKILTVEDPVEYEIEGIMQVPVNLAADLTFARALRSFLRQDPDIVMVGEIRDLETAQIAVQAALTGHLVLTTLHTNDAPSALTRLTDMGIEPFLLASTVEAVLAQRLVRRLCPACRVPVADAAALFLEHGLDPAAAVRGTVCRSVGCPACHQTGYHGRLGLFELLRLDETLREQVVAGAPLADLRRQARAGGLVPLREAGLPRVLAGETTVEELVRYT